jgi:hypothetical protein
VLDELKEKLEMDYNQIDENTKEKVGPSAFLCFLLPGSYSMLVCRSYCVILSTISPVRCPNINIL